jgi:GAF domain-containing protein
MRAIHCVALVGFILSISSTAIAQAPRFSAQGVINLQHRHPNEHSWAEIQLVATVGFLVGAEIEMARLECENSQLSERLETRKAVDRAKGILQRDLESPRRRISSFRSKPPAPAIQA